MLPRMCVVGIYPCLLLSRISQESFMMGLLPLGVPSINDAGANLLNGLIDVLTRIRVGKHVCMADLSKCFFQVAMSAEQ